MTTEIRKRKGFTLVEMLIVLAIVGVLTSVAIASISASRIKARDTKRISDMKEVQLGLALYYDVNRAYPADLTTLVTQKYIPSLPVDPAGTAYEYLVTSGRYCFGAKLEGVIPSDSTTCTSAASGSTANYKAQPPQ
ncbi:prepilin-type N-terminal cleavage/methylation domain-containing protein [Candidatus Parcubacteria bacterium]|nr:prepilin-type N-terminal cleavage/methylation domain-containing protein [Candidatus Parcubacteria bacterium]